MMELFSIDLDEYENHAEPCENVLIHDVNRGRLIPSSAKILGRCTRCGSAVTDMFDYCPDCLNFDFCNCDHCLDIGTLHVKVLVQLYYAYRDYDTLPQWREDRINRLTKQAYNYRNQPLNCWRVK
ncbi:hypothetical protein EGM51_03745 [Verrucomicrobia bacterium S94]|nr:hypothetical protein EGM51_03745 [Verrucomicrobia bacterium S94]